MRLKIKYLILLTTTTALTVFENKILNVNNLVRKADCDEGKKILKTNISPHLIIIKLRIIYLMRK